MKSPGFSRAFKHSDLDSRLAFAAVIILTFITSSFAQETPNQDIRIQTAAPEAVLPEAWLRWLRLEKAFLVRAVELNDSQKKELNVIIASTSWIDEPVWKYLMTDVERIKQELNHGEKQSMEGTPFQFRRFQRSYVSQTRQILTVEQKEIVEAEQAAKKEYHRRRNALGTMIAMNRQLNLSLEQFDAIESILNSSTDFELQSPDASLASCNHVEELQFLPGNLYRDDVVVELDLIQRKKLLNKVNISSSSDHFELAVKQANQDLWGDRLIEE